MTASALPYARISVTDAKVPKVANQLSDLRKLGNARSYANAGEYVHDGLSAAKAENRPDFDRLLADLAAPIPARSSSLPRKRASPAMRWKRPG